MLSGSSTLHAVTGRAHFPSIFGPSVSLTPPAAQPPRMSVWKERKEEETTAAAGERTPINDDGRRRHRPQIQPDDHCRNDCRSGRKSESSFPIPTAFGGVPSLSSFPVYSDYVVVVLVTVWRRLLVAQTTVLLLLPNRSTKNAIRPRTTPLRNLTQAGSLLLLGNELSETREMVFVAVMLVAFEKINADFTTTALELFGCAHCSGMTGEGDYHGTREM